MYGYTTTTTVLYIHHAVDGGGGGVVVRGRTNRESLFPSPVFRSFFLSLLDRRPKPEDRRKKEVFVSFLSFFLSLVFFPVVRCSNGSFAVEPSSRAERETFYYYGQTTHRARERQRQTQTTEDGETKERKKEKKYPQKGRKATRFFSLENGWNKQRTIH